ncbi:MAG: hypothetical protein KAV18_02475 [Candidatus Omnitrophica bacterium]|nr:hypothetical protein [Candidatus Omnitrophota bacterium]
MSENDLEGPELQRRAELFKPWLEDEATKTYLAIISRKVKSLEKNLKAAPMETHEKVIGNLQGKIEMGEKMIYLPVGAIKSYDRRVERERQKREKEKERLEKV